MILDEALSKEDEDAFAQMQAADAAPGAEGPAPEAPAAPEKQPEERQEAPEAGEGAPKPGVVPYGALKEEREARRALERQVAELNAQFARADERLKLLAPKAPEPAPPPDPNYDPIGAQEYDRTRVQSLEQKLAAIEAEKQQEHITREVTSVYMQAAKEAEKHVPDFKDAYNHLVNVRRQQLQIATGGRVPPQAIEKRLMEEELQFVMGNLQQGQNPAAAIYHMAKATGYQPKAPAAAAPRQTEAAPEAERLERVARGQSENRSLSSVGSGATVGGPTTAKDLASMSDDEFDKWMAKNGEAAFQKLAGASR